MTPIEQLNEKLAEFEALQWKWLTLGASDSEPDGIFQEIIYSAATKEPFSIPVTGMGWDLFFYIYVQDNIPSEEEYNVILGQAVDELSITTKDIVDLIQKNIDSPEIIMAIKDYCWRI
jgi:hypothetical protein